MFNKFKLMKEIESGQSLVLFALILSILIGVGALVIDIGKITIEKSNLQKTIDSACLAAVQDLPTNTTVSENTAIDYIEKNGYLEANIVKPIIFSNSDKKITITAEQPVKYTFANIFNMGNSKTVKLKASAEVFYGSALDDFDYAIFSGSEINILHLTGSKTTVSGDVHSNNSIKGQAAVTGTVTAVGSIDTKIDATVDKDPFSTVIEMPDFSETIKKLAEDASTYYTGDKTFSPSELNTKLALNKAIYVDGNVTISGTGVCSTAGCILATGNITFNGSNVTLNSSSPLCLYSSNGNITFDGGSSNVYGIVYAPEGKVTFNGSGGDIYGRLIGDVVDINGAINIVSSDDDLISIDGTEKKYRLVE